MPDASTHRPRHSSWSEAFAAMPAETPPAGGWERVARALPARRRRWPALVALAAALALVAIVPLHRATRDAAPSAPLVHAPATAVEPTRALAVQPASAEPVQPVQIAEGPRSGSSPADVAIRDAEVIANVAADSATTPAPEPMDAPAASAAEASTQPSTGITDTVQLATSPAPASREEPAEPAATPELERLYAESAQLEGLLALARDGGGVANGAVAMLSDDLATRVAQIDAALMQPSLASDRRIALWRERVDALRQAAAFESTQRLLAARGQQYDAMLVSID